MINLLPTTTESIPSIDSFSIFTGNYEPTTINTIFCNVKQDLDISDAEAETQLQALLQEFNSVFDLSEKTPAKVPGIDLKLKPEFANKTFYCPEPLRSTADQAVIDRNAEELIKADRAYFNPYSKHNIGQVIVHRFNKQGAPITGREFA